MSAPNDLMQEASEMGTRVLGSRVLGSRAMPTPSSLALHCHCLLSSFLRKSTEVNFEECGGCRECISTLYLPDNRDFQYANKPESKQEWESEKTTDRGDETNQHVEKQYIVCDII